MHVGVAQKITLRMSRLHMLYAKLEEEHGLARPPSDSVIVRSTAPSAGMLFPSTTAQQRLWKRRRHRTAEPWLPRLSDMKRVLHGQDMFEMYGILLRKTAELFGP